MATFLGAYGLPVMTLPFCFATLPFILIQGTTKRILAVPLSSITTPEDHWRRYAPRPPVSAFSAEPLTLLEPYWDRDSSSAQNPLQPR